MILALAWFLIGMVWLAALVMISVGIVLLHDMFTEDQ